MRTRNCIVGGLILVGIVAIGYFIQLQFRSTLLTLRALEMEEIPSRSVSLSQYVSDMAPRVIPGIRNNASGITFAPDRGTFFVAVNAESKLVELDRALNPIREIHLKGFEDTEGVAYAGANTLVVSDERFSSISMIVLSNSLTEVAREDCQSLALLMEGDDNSTYEGLGVDLETRTIHVVKENDPQTLISISGFLEGGRQLRIGPHPGIQVDQLGLDDLSGVHHDPVSSHYLILSQESGVVVEVNAEGDLISFMSLRGQAHGLDKAVPQPEGVTLDDQGVLYIVSEPNLLYRFRKTSASETTQVSSLDRVSRQ